MRKKKLIQHPFLFDDNSKSLKVHSKHSFLLNFVELVCHPERSRGFSNSLQTQLFNFISLFIRGFIALWMSIKKYKKEVCYERCRVLASQQLFY